MLRLIEFFLIRWSDFARRSGWALIALFVAATGLAGFYAATHLKVNTDTSEMLDPDLPFQRNAAALRDAFPEIKTDLIIIVKGETLDEADAFAAMLRERIIADKEAFSAVFAPAEEPFFLNNGLLYLDTPELESRLAQMSKAAGLIETLVKSPRADTLYAALADNDKLAEKSDLGQETLEDIYAELGDVVEASLKGETRPFSWMGAIDTEDPPQQGYLRLVYATPVLDYTRLQPAKTAISAIRADVAELEKKFDNRVEVFITGDPALRAEELEAVSTGIGLSFLLSFILVSILLVIAFRSAALAAMTMAALVITLGLTSAFAAVAVGELNLVSIAFTILLVGLGLDFAIHLLLHVQERRASGQDMRLALRGSMHEVGAGLALAAMTTMLSFLSFMPTRFDGIAQLGVIAGAGVVIAFFVSVTFIPAALGAAPNARARASRGAVRRRFSWLGKLSKPVAILTIILGLAALIYVPQARFDADPMSLRNPNAPSVKGFNLLFTDEDTEPYRLTRLVPTQEEAEQTSVAVKKLDTVAGARSLPDFVPDDQEEKLDLISFASGSMIFALEAEPDPDAPVDTGGALALEKRLEEAHGQGPGARLAELLGQTREKNDPALDARIEKNIFAFWPLFVSRVRAEFNAEQISLDSLPKALAGRYLSAAGQWRVDILPAEDMRDQKALARFVDSVSALYPDISGGAIQFLKAGEVISNSMLEATGVALGVILIVLWLLVRRLTLVLLMMGPLLLAASLTTATSVLANIPFNYANVIVLPLLLGIGVDSGIHLVLRQQQVKAGDDVYGTSTPRAVFFSAATTVASFGSLMLSPHRGTASMGELLSIAIGYTLVCTLVVLPAAFRFGEARAAARAEKTQAAD